MGRETAHSESRVWDEPGMGRDFTAHVAFLALISDELGAAARIAAEMWQACVTLREIVGK